MFFHEAEPEPLMKPYLRRHQTEADLSPLVAYVTAEQLQPQPLINENIEYFDVNETVVQPDTIQAYVDDTYLPGDRLQKGAPAPRKTASKRQTPRRKGYPCNADGCVKIFDRACELK